MKEQVAVIDIGSNSIRMSVIQTDGERMYQIICQMKEALRLSALIDNQGNLPPEAIRRTVQVLHAFARQIRLLDAKNVYAVATAALRKAENRLEVLEEIRRETGIQVDIISGEDEAFYDYLGVIYTMPKDNFVLIDTGGGSTELVLVQERKMTARTSIPYGAVVLQETFSGRMEQMQVFLKKVLREIPFLKECEGMEVVGLGGSIRALGKAHGYSLHHPFIGIHEYPMTSKEVLHIYGQLCQLPPAGRERKYDISGSRRDIITAGLAPLAALVQEIKAPRLTISGNGVREGIFFQKSMKYPVDMQVLGSSVNNMMALYGLNHDRANRLYREASILAGPYPGLAPYGHLLYTACMLSETGVKIDYYNHPRHTFFVLTGLPVYGLSPVEKVMCALAAAGLGRGMRKGIYAKYYGMLDRRQAAVAQQLAAAVHMASSLLFYGFFCRRIAYDSEQQKVFLTICSEEKGLVLPDATRSGLQKRWRSAFGTKCKLIQEEPKG